MVILYMYLFLSEDFRVLTVTVWREGDVATPGPDLGLLRYFGFNEGFDGESLSLCILNANRCNLYSKSVIISQFLEIFCCHLFDFAVSRNCPLFSLVANSMEKASPNPLLHGGPVHRHHHRLIFRRRLK